MLTTETWVARLAKWTPTHQLSMELVRFDMQQLENPEISGTEYQSGTLAGFEAKGYLLQQWGHQCVYCGAKDIPLEVEHIHLRSRGGSDRVSNLAIACVPCNQKKAAQSIEQFLEKKPELLKRILLQAKVPLRDAAAVNSTRWKLYETLKAFGFPVETGTGGRTKFNRSQQGFGKDHWLDAACVGESGFCLRLPAVKPLLIKCMGRGSRQACRTDKYGFPNKWQTRQKVFFGFQTGDMVRAEVPIGKNEGRHTGRVSVRATGSFALATKEGKRDGINRKYFRTIQRQDDYGYS